MKDKIIRELVRSIKKGTLELEDAHKQASIHGSQEDVELTVSSYLGRLSRLIAAAIILDPTATSNSTVVENAIEVCELLDEDRLSFLCQFYSDDLAQWDFSLAK